MSSSGEEITEVEVKGEDHPVLVTSQDEDLVVWKAVKPFSLRCRTSCWRVRSISAVLIETPTSARNRINSR